jgi:hypothetical protein
MDPHPRRRHRRARTVAIAAALLGATPLAVGAPARAQDSHPHRLVQTVVWQSVGDPPLLGSPVCQQESCVLPFSFLGRTTGDLIGSFAQAGGGTRFADGTIYANSVLVFVGTITRCGTGTVALSSTGFNRAGSTSGQIVIAEGSGTGQLAGITGSGDVVDGQADPSGNGGGSGTIVMRLHCTTHPSTPSPSGEPGPQRRLDVQPTAARDPGAHTLRATQR